MTKSEAIERIGLVTAGVTSTTNNVYELIDEMENVDSIALVTAILLLANTVNDSMANLALILSESMPHELPAAHEQVVKEDLSDE